jgi:WS/DGAT/MGAT family acyltransferase
MATPAKTLVSDSMSGSDALLWTISADPVMRPTIVALVVLDGPPSWLEVRARVEDLTVHLPRLRACVAARGPRHLRPRFVPDDTFELDTHLRRVSLPAHGGLRDVLDMAQTMATSGFDTALPLWEATLVEGVDGDRAVLVMKVHHALIDGVGGLAALAHLFDVAGARPAVRGEPAAAARPATASADSAETPVGGGDEERGHRRTLLPDAVQVVDDALDAVRHPLRSLNQLATLSGSVARLLAPAIAPVSPIMRGRGVRRHAEVLDIDLPTLKGAARAWGGTLNDVFVTAVMRGLSVYHEQHGASSPGFRTLMPVNVRAQEEGELGNRFVPVRFVVPDRGDVAECMAEVQRLTTEWKHAPSLAVSDALAGGLSALPDPVARGLWASMLRGNDVCITNVPGPPVPVTLGGAGVEAIYALSPPSGAALNVAMVTTADRACIAITADAAAIPDCAKLAGCIDDGFAEVCSAHR